MNGPTGNRPTTGSRGERSRILAAYFDGARAAAAGRPALVPDGLTGAALDCWLDGYAEGRADHDLDDRSVGCAYCSDVGCLFCVLGVAA